MMVIYGHQELLMAMNGQLRLSIVIFS